MLLFSQPVSEMRDEIQKLDSRINGLVPKNVAVNKTVHLASQKVAADVSDVSDSKRTFALSLSVHKTLHDLNHRQRNVVVAGSIRKVL